MYIIENIHYLKKDLNGLKFIEMIEKLRKKLQKNNVKIKAREFFKKNSFYLKRWDTYIVKKIYNNFIDHENQNINIKMYKLLITGNLGYIGPVLTDYFKKKYKNKIHITGVDCDYFKNFKSEIFKFEKNSVDNQIFEDVRNFSIIKNKTKYDGIILLAAISNDPIGNKFIKQTHEINIKANKRLIKESIKIGIKNITFAGSCSIYGNSGR